MPSRRSQDEPVTRYTVLLTSVTAALLLFAPLLRSGKLSYGLAGIEMLGIVLMILALWNPGSWQRIPRLVWLLVLTTLLIPVLYLIPLPLALWQSLPGRELYTESLTFLTTQNLPLPYLSLSLVPYRTLLAGLALLPVIGMLLATLSLPQRQLGVLTYVFLGIASFQAALGLVQYGSGAEWAFFWDQPDGNATGTYANRDHFAALMELAIPLALGLAAYHIHPPRTERSSPRQELFNQAVIFFTLSIILILAGVFSRSRAGVILTIVGILLSAFIFSRHVGGRQSAGLNTLLIGITAGVATSMGLAPVLNRFALDPMNDVRWEIFQAVVSAIKQFFPFGSGPGAFQSVFYAFQPPDLPKFINHAHNDYLELGFETGLIALLPLLLILLLYIQGWWQLRQQQWGRLRFIQTAAGISLLLMALHGLADFNFHTPANTIFFAFLAGIFLHRQQKSPR